jgi:hypothetical protein
LPVPVSPDQHRGIAGCGALDQRQDLARAMVGKDKGPGANGQGRLRAAVQRDQVVSILVHWPGLTCPGWFLVRDEGHTCINRFYSYNVNQVNRH